MSDHHKVVSSEGLLIKDQDLMALLDRSDLVSNAALQRKSGRPKKGQEHNGLFRVLATDIPASQWVEELSREEILFFFSSSVKVLSFEFLVSKKLSYFDYFYEFTWFCYFSKYLLRYLIFVLWDIDSKGT